MDGIWCDFGLQPVRELEGGGSDVTETDPPALPTVAYAG